MTRPTEPASADGEGDHAAATGTRPGTDGDRAAPEGCRRPTDAAGASTHRGSVDAYGGTVGPDGQRGDLDSDVTRSVAPRSGPSRPAAAFDLDSDRDAANPGGSGPRSHGVERSWSFS